LVLGAAYMLSLYKRVVFGEVTNPEAGRMKDLSVREMVIFAPLVVLVVVMGIYPRFVLQPIAPSVAKIVSGLETAGVIEKPVLHQLADLPAENPQ